MHLDATASAAAASAPGFSHAQLARLACSVEQRRQQLKSEIDAFIARKHDELRQFAHEVRALAVHSATALPHPDHTVTNRA